MINQEQGAVLDPKMSATAIVVTYVLIPVALFVGISLFAYATTISKTESEDSVLTHIK
ncbi:unannotated protein [freshwater metagenome]|uniref:Unannotated protein n=1 Tax=freshwater metagenome TaxID=449393 RepID=A0A6J7XWM8_9ZZZZ